MKTLFIYNSNSGRRTLKRKLFKICFCLEKTLGNVDVYASTSKEDFINKCRDACNEYDYLIFAGGDGTFNMVIQSISNQHKRPIIGVLPCGTVNDAAKNFKIRSISQGLKAIKKGKTRYFDIGKISDYYFSFVACIGAYADIPIIVSASKKMQMGKLAYYSRAMKDVLFKTKKISGKICIDNNEYLDFETGFLLIMNSTHVGGFNINSHSQNDDGKMDVFYSKPGPFNGLFPYFFPKKLVKHYQAKYIDIQFNNCNDIWDIDGEPGPKGNATINVLANHIKIFSNK